MKRTLRVLAIAATPLLLTHVVRAAEATREPFKVVEITSLTGPAMGAFLPAAQGFEAYVNYTNRTGGIDGHPIELQVLNDQSSASIGGALFQSAVVSAPLAIAHFGLSTILTQARSTITDVPIAILTSSADDSLLYPSPFKNVFMMNASAKQQARVWIAYVERVLGGLKGKKIGVAAAQSAYCDSMLATVKDMAREKGYEVATVERFTTGLASFSSQAGKIARLQPDAVLVAPLIAADVPIVVRGLSDAGVTIAPIVGFSTISSNELLQKLDLANYAAFRPFKVAADVPGLAPKVASSFSGSMTGSNWSLGWATGEILANALHRCGADCSGQKLIGLLEDGQPTRVADDVLYGSVMFSPISHAGLTAVQPYRLEGTDVAPAGPPISIAE